MVLDPSPPPLRTAMAALLHLRMTEMEREGGGRQRKTERGAAVGAAVGAVVGAAEDRKIEKQQQKERKRQREINATAVNEVFAFMSVMSYMMKKNK